MQTIKISNVERQNVKIGNAQTIIMGGDIYEGEYTVNPDFTGKTLPTHGKTMINDVTVNPIEVQRVSNEYGKTVYIGGIING